MVGDGRAGAGVGCPPQGGTLLPFLMRPPACPYTATLHSHALTLCILLPKAPPAALTFTGSFKAHPFSLPPLPLRRRDWRVCRGGGG